MPVTWAKEVAIRIKVPGSNEHILYYPHRSAPLSGPQDTDMALAYGVSVKKELSAADDNGHVRNLTFRFYKPGLYFIDGKATPVGDQAKAEWKALANAQNEGRDGKTLGMLPIDFGSMQPRAIEITQNGQVIARLNAAFSNDRIHAEGYMLYREPGTQGKFQLHFYRPGFYGVRAIENRGGGIISAQEVQIAGEPILPKPVIHPVQTKNVPRSILGNLRGTDKKFQSNFANDESALRRNIKQAKIDELLKVSPLDTRLLHSYLFSDVGYQYFEVEVFVSEKSDQPRSVGVFYVDRKTGDVLLPLTETPKADAIPAPVKIGPGPDKPVVPPDVPTPTPKAPDPAPATKEVPQRAVTPPPIIVDPQNKSDTPRPVPEPKKDSADSSDLDAQLNALKSGLPPIHKTSDELRKILDEKNKEKHVHEITADPLYDTPVGTFKIADIEKALPKLEKALESFTDEKSSTKLKKMTININALRVGLLPPLTGNIIHVTHDQSEDGMKQTIENALREKKE